MLRRTVAALALVSLAAAVGAAAHPETKRQRLATAPPDPTFFISGRGWGHGVGLSQWGAYGFAQRGASYQRILAHYYRGTTLGKAPVARVRVLLAEGRASATVSSAAAFRVRDGIGDVHQLRAGTYAFGPALKLKIGEKKARALRPPLLFTPSSQPLRFGAGTPYRGQLQVNVTGRKLQVVNVVGLEQYLYGVVPREVPWHWAAEALKAQAVVARSYALAVRKTGAFDLYPDTRSQVYGGIGAERATTNAAVNATAGQVLFYGSKIATTFFFSTSGGRTASIGDVWRGGQRVPYLVSVPDPYDSISPHHSWGPFAFTAARLRRAFRVPGRLLDVRTVANASQRVDSVIAIGSRGQVVARGSDVRRSLGLRSTWFRVGVLGLERPERAVVYGSQARLSGLARGVGRVRLEQRAGRLWEPASRPVPDAEGRVSAVVKPLASSDYRLAVSASIASRPVRVSVAPYVRIEPVTERTALRGIVRPVLRGVQVEVQRVSGGTWKNVASARVAAGGRFVASLKLRAGTYRVRVAPGGGFVPGVSPVLRVASG